MKFWQKMCIIFQPFFNQKFDPFDQGCPSIFWLEVWVLFIHLSVIKEPEGCVKNLLWSSKNNHDSPKSVGSRVSLYIDKCIIDRGQTVWMWIKWQFIIIPKSACIYFKTAAQLNRWRSQRDTETLFKSIWTE